MKYKEIRFFRPLTETYSLHFYLIQFLGSLYMIYRIFSRSYVHLGLFPHSDKLYLRSLFHEYFPIPPSYFTTFQFIYDLFPFIENSTNNICFWNGLLLFHQYLFFLEFFQDCFHQLVFSVIYILLG